MALQLRDPVRVWPARHRIRDPPTWVLFDARDVIQMTLEMS